MPLSRNRSLIAWFGEEKTISDYESFMELVRQERAREALLEGFLGIQPHSSDLDQLQQHLQKFEREWREIATD